MISSFWSMLLRRIKFMAVRGENDMMPVTSIRCRVFGVVEWRVYKLIYCWLCSWQDAGRLFRSVSWHGLWIQVWQAIDSCADFTRVSSVSISTQWLWHSLITQCSADGLPAISRKHETLTQCCFNASPTYTTLVHEVLQKKVMSTPIINSVLEDDLEKEII